MTAPALSAPAAPVAPAAAKPVNESAIAEIQRAIDEQRYVDAAGGINQALVAGANDPRLSLLTGELSLARSRYDDALASFKSVDSDPAVQPRALQGEGIALSELKHSDEAVTVLQKAVLLDPGAWRAWSALGAEYDARRDWADAENAYNHALGGSHDAPAVLNNRGYSRLLQNRLDDAIADFVAALQKKPDLGPARTNLRFAIAMKGEYARAVEGATPENKAALLNNAGFAAMLRGDYAKAQDLLAQAVKAKGEYYTRASQNLEMAQGMQAREVNPAAGQTNGH
jgi:Flp pilus assembly protein TadD